MSDEREARSLRPLLSEEERARADGFDHPAHRRRFTVAHGWKRRILAAYAGGDPADLRFVVGPRGKPSLDGASGAGTVEFNLSHSGDLALLAVARTPIGVDVERRDTRIEHLELAERYFSTAETSALRSLAGDSGALVAGFFDAWSRKEAYLKATGHGIAFGLQHFDVSLAPGAPICLITDRRDPEATRRWTLAALDVAPGYSAAAAVESPPHRILIFDADAVRGAMR